MRGITMSTAVRATRYVAYVILPDTTLTDLSYQWMLFNDDQVTAVTEADVLNADAYLLFYNLRSLASAPQ